MTGVSLMSIALTCLWSISAVAPAIASESPQVEALQPAIVDVTPSRVYAPMGFDDNDNAQIVIDGLLPDTCYKLGHTLIRIDHATAKVHVRQQAFYYPGAWCADVRIPYVQTVNLGILKSGQYEILIEKDDEAPVSTTSLPIAISTTQSPDDFLYAPITDAHLEKSSTAFEGVPRKTPTVVLNGYFSSTCMSMRTVKMDVRPNNVIEVRPIVNMERGIACAQVASEFKVAVPLGQIQEGRYLIHIRSLNGQSINRVVDL